MSHAFLFLLSRSFINRTRARLKRLKQPKYLIGALFGIIYLYGYFFQFMFARGRPAENMFGGANAVIGGIGAIVLLFLVISAWIFPHQRAALVFSEAEIAFLFPAPVSRRSLIHYKLLKSQLAILFTVLLLTLITGRLFISSQAWMRVLGWWVILSTLNLHFLGASFARTILMDQGISNWFRRSVVLLLLTALVVITGFWMRQTVLPPAVANLADWSAWNDYLRALIETPPLSYLLAPFYIVLGPYLATTPLEFAKAFSLVLPVLALHYLWVIRSNVAFEEASLEVSRRFAEKISAARQGKTVEGRPRTGSRPPFVLAPVGFTPIAFLWKNLISARATFRGRTLIFVVIPIVVGGVVMGAGGTRGSAMLGTAAILTLMLFVWSLFIGAQLVRCDLRQDLSAMDVIRLYPLRGWQVVAGELMAPLIILTVVQFLLLILLAVLSFTGAGAIRLPQLPLTWFVAAAIVAPFWNGLVLLIPNAAVLLFPGWFQSRADAPQGIEVTGQRLLLLFGQMIVVGISIIPAAVGFSLGFVPVHLAGAEVLAPLTGAVAGAIVLAGEIVLGIWLVGKLFDRFDLAAEQG